MSTKHDYVVKTNREIDAIINQCRIFLDKENRRGLYYREFDEDGIYKNTSTLRKNFTETFIEIMEKTKEK